MTYFASNGLVDGSSVHTDHLPLMVQQLLKPGWTKGELGFAMILTVPSIVYYSIQNLRYKGPRNPGPSK